MKSPKISCTGPYVLLAFLDIYLECQHVAINEPLLRTIKHMHKQTNLQIRLIATAREKTPLIFSSKHDTERNITCSNLVCTSSIYFDSDYG